MAGPPFLLLAAALLSLAVAAAGAERPGLVFQRPGLYFGTRSAGTHPVLTGLAWQGATRLDDLRHSCEHRHELQSWGWQLHNGRDFGVETIGDSSRGVNLTIEWVHDATCGGWAAVVTGAPAAAAAAAAPPTLVSLFAYAVAPDGGALDAPSPLEGGAVLAGRARAESGAFALTVERLSGAPGQAASRSVRSAVLLPPANTSAPAGGGLGDARFVGARLAPDAAWRVEEVLAGEAAASERAVRLAAFRAQAKAERDAAARAAAAADGAPPPPPAAKPTASERALLRADRPIAPLLSGTWAPGANVGVVQLVLEVPFKVQLALVQGTCADGSGPAAAPPPSAPAAAWLERQREQGFAPAAVPELIAARRAALRSRLCRSLGQACGHEEAAGGANERVATSALANLLGSITEFHGRQLVPGPGGVGTVESPPHSLITGVPSRSFFPRGFLWDEGFHLLIVSQFDAGLAARGLGSWLATMDADGWIAREQILGSEARSRVPEQFQRQSPDIANPPTVLLPALVLAVDALCGGGDSAATTSAAALSLGADGAVSAEPAVAGGEVPWNETRRAAFCERHARRAGGGGEPSCRYACRNSAGAAARPSSDASQVYAAVAAAVPRLLRHYAWFERTQAGARPGSFRWRGATPDHSLASGLDDYPRGLAPTADDESVDLLSWMAMAAHVLADLGGLVGVEGATVARLAAAASAAEARVLSEHWDARSRSFCDIGAVRSRRKGAAVVSGDGDGPAAPAPAYEIGRVCHLGYVSLLPLALRLLPAASPQLDALLAAAADRKTLLAPATGLLRSLSKAHPLHGRGEDYWRGAAWVNVNWLVAAAMRHYGAAGGGGVAERAAAQGDALGRAIVGTLAAEYARSGFVWESYDAASGRGRGTHPFTGWSALVALEHAGRHPF